MSDAIELILAVKYGPHAIKALVREDWMDVEEDALSDEVRADPEKYLKDNIGDSFEWLGESGTHHDGGEIDFRFKFDGQFYEGNGTYSSWGNSYRPSLDDFYEVRPVQKTITVYERVE